MDFTKLAKNEEIERKIEDCCIQFLESLIAWECCASKTVSLQRKRLSSVSKNVS